MSATYQEVRRHAYGDVLREHRRSRPNMLAAIDGDLRFSFLELDARVNRLVFALRARGISQGDRMLWLGQNSFKVLEVMLAAAKIGAVLCPANWRMSVAEIRSTLEDFDPRVVFWQDAETGETHRTSRIGWSEGRFWIQHDGSEHDCFNQLIEEGVDQDDDQLVDPKLPLLAFYTAGFTGRPSAALLSHTGLLLQAIFSGRGQAIDERSRYLVSGPMFHLGVLMGGLATFVTGGTLVFVSRPDAEEMVRLIDHAKVTHAFIPQPLVPRMAKAIADGDFDVSTLFARPDLSDWEHPLIMPVTAPQRINRRSYGQTELSGMCVAGWFGGEAAGRPNPFAQIKILDDDGNEVPSDVIGEIAVRGPLVMCGYYNRPELNVTRGGGGWHRTNDLGKRLKDGSILFVGPKTALIKSGIENIYPAEVEACIGRHPRVADVCVIGVPDPLWDQCVKAVIVCKEGVQPTESEIIEHCREHIASYKKPKIVVFVKELPRGAGGIIDRDAVDREHGGGGYPSIGVKA
jgi:acyl-CoA synthetase (AMP-forming)/AMP-acid ligase II